MSISIKLKIKDRPILIVGGGNVAYRKLIKIIEDQPKVTLVAKEFCPSMVNFFTNNHSASFVKVYQRAYEMADLKDQWMVFAATEDKALNNAIYDACKVQGILCQMVSNGQGSDFSFVAEKKISGLTVSVSTEDGLPAFSKRYVERMAAPYVEEIETLYPIYKAIRALALSLITNERERRKLLKSVAAMDKEEMKALHETLKKLSESEANI